MMCRIQPLDVFACELENKTPTEKRRKEVLEIIHDTVSQFLFSLIV